MFTIARNRRVLLVALLGVLLVALAACGGAPATAAIDPETRVKGFFNDFSSALNDPNISQPAKQDEWAGKLAGYAKPDQQNSMKGEMKQALEQFGGIGAQLSSLTGGQANLDIKLQMSFENIQTKLASQSGSSAKVELTGGTLKMGLVGKDVDKLGDVGKSINQETPIAEFLNQTSGNNSNVISLELVDGVWYITDLVKK